MRHLNIEKYFRLSALERTFLKKCTSTVQYKYSTAQYNYSTLKLQYSTSTVQYKYSTVQTVQSVITQYSAV
jgi:hypothetical protein